LTDFRSNYALIFRRDCFNVDVYYFETVQDIPEHLGNSDIANPDFEAFLWSLGWPVNLSSHVGYSGHLEKEKCPVTPYFANLTMEVIFKCPYLFRRENARRLSLQAKRSFSSVDDFDLIPNSEDPLVFNPTIRPPRTRSKSVGIPSVLASDMIDNTLQDCFAIVWLEDIHNVGHLVSQLPKHFAGCIMVHPLPHTAGMYYIRLLLKAGIIEECLVKTILTIVCWTLI
jgi:Rap/ran-GAP